MAKGKILSDNFIMEIQSENLFRSILPDNYLLRKYSMDFGIDYDLELFEREDNHFVTQGEHILIQLKSSNQLKHEKIKPFDLRYGDEVIDVVVFRIELSFIELVERMGDAIPVLLILADLNHHVMYYICINDYIHYTLGKTTKKLNAKSINLYIPVRNRLSCDLEGIFPIQFYGKRSKLISFCNRIQIISKDFEYCRDIEETMFLIRKTVNWCLSLDIWTIEKRIPTLHYFFIEIQRIKKNNYISPKALKQLKRLARKDDPTTILFDVCGFTELSYDNALILLTGHYLSDELSTVSAMLDSYVFSCYLP